MSCLKKSAQTCLATYGTLAPGRANHNRLAKLKGVWRQGTVKGGFLDASIYVIDASS